MRQKRAVPGARPAAGERRHGLSEQALAAMRLRQGGRCLVCGRVLPPVPHVDHDHALAARHPHDPRVGCPRCVRGLLDNDCNSMLGFARDDPEVLRAGAAYVELAREAAARR